MRRRRRVARCCCRRSSTSRCSMDGATIRATCRAWLPCGSLRRERERQAGTDHPCPLSLRKMLALCVCPRRVVPPMDPPHTAKAFPNCGQESHTRVHVLALIFKITVLTPSPLILVHESHLETRVSHLKIAPENHTPGHLMRAALYTCKRYMMRAV